MITIKDKINFLLACERGNFENVKNLIERFGLIDTSEIDNGWTALMRSASFGKNANIVKFLINSGYKVDEQDTEDGSTALINSAMEYDNEAVIETLLSLGANIDYQDDEGETALMSAITANSLSSVKCLLKHGANTKIMNNHNQNAIDIAVMMDYDNINLFLKESGYL